MAKNKGKGGKSKRKGKNKGHEGEKRELIKKEPGQEYAQVNRILGNCRVTAYCFDGKERLCHVRGKFRRRVWINRDDIILVGLREFQDDKADVIHRYSAEEARLLKHLKELPAKARIDVDTIPSDEEEGEDLEELEVLPQRQLNLEDLSMSSDEDDEEDDIDSEDSRDMDW